MTSTRQELLEEVASLRARLIEGDEILRAIRNGEVDAVLAQGPHGDQLFTLKGADDPYRVLIEEMNQGAVTLSADGSILYCNRRFAHLLKRPMEKIVGLAFEVFVAPAERAAFTAMLGTICTGGSAGEFTLCASDGSAVPVQLALGCLPAESAAAICLIATDISESREKEARLHGAMAALVETEKEAGAARAEAERANAAKSEFLANMSHEIRTPMNGIIGMTDLALETGLNDEQREYLGMVKSSAHSLLSLINNILDFSKIEAGKLELEMIDFTLRDCLSELLKPLGIHAEQKGLQLLTDISADVPDRLVGDPLRLCQILINLTDNAIKFTQRGSIVVKVAAGLDDDGQRLHFSVQDTGLGIPLEKQGVIFEAFAQADGSTTRNHGGTGLGLAIVSQLVEQMHGKLWVESVVGAGTTFHFTARFDVAEKSSPLLPVSAPLKLSRAPANSVVDFDRRQAVPTGLRILLAEDNAINRALASGILEKRGHSLVHAVNGREAVESAAREPFDLIFMDVQMPKVGGFEATRRIREREAPLGRHTPIVAMTAHAMRGDRQLCLAAGMDDYLSKPLNKAELLALIARISPRERPAGRSQAEADSTRVPHSAMERGSGANIAMKPKGWHSTRIACAASLFAILLGLSVLVGWAFDLRPVMTVIPGSVAMKPNTAVSLCLSGLSLLLFVRREGGGTRRTKIFSLGLAWAVALLGTLTLVEYAAGWNAGIDELLFRDFVRGAIGYAPGRMAPISAINFAALGLALVFLHVSQRRAWAQALTVGVAVTALLASVDYFLGVQALYKPGNSTAVALHTALGFLALCVGVWCASSRHGFMQVFTGSGTSGKLARAYGFAAIILPCLFAWLALQGDRLGWYSAELGVAMLAMTTVLAFVTLIWDGARSLQAAERKEAAVRESLRQAHEVLELRVQQRTAELSASNADLQKQIRERTRVEHANQQIMDHSLDVICTIDVEGRFLQVGRACESLWGYQPEELIGRRYLDLVHPEDRAPTIAASVFIMKGTPAVDFENRYLRRDGSVVSIVWTANWSEQHQIMFCVARDITARKQLEGELLRAKEAAEAANQAKSEFLANMSHEIRTPMNGIIGMTDLVLDTKLDREQRDYLDMAKSSAHSLLGLINDILDFSKIEAGKLELESIGFSLRDCIGAMLKPLGIQADQKGLELTADIPAAVPDHVIGDPMRLRQILINLTNNAIKFTARGDVMLRVAVESAADDEHCLHFSVADTGIGIPQEKQALIFEAFAQADGTTTRNHGGTGLGLAIATPLVRQMGGRIWVESIVGQGTTFHFTARMPVRLTPAPDVRHADPGELEDMRVLVVDDNAVNRRILREMLAHWRMQPSVVASGAAAIVEMLRAAHAGTPFPLVILDGMMPEMDGFVVAKKIRECAELSGATVMMLSSAMPAGASARCGELGIASYLIKPVARAELLDAILVAIVRAAVIEPVSLAVAPIIQPTASLRILVAEDNVINRAVISSILEKNGHSVVQAVDGREAVEATSLEVFDLILMDVQMPEVDGFEATRLIRNSEQSAGRRTPIVAMTAHAMDGDRERCLNAGMDDYLPKPLQKPMLFALLARISARRNPPAGTPAFPPDDFPSPARVPSTRALSCYSRDELLDQLDGDAALLQRLIVLFRENTPRLLKEIRGAVARGSSDDLARGAHALLGSLAAFGAHCARNFALQLEAQAHDQDFECAGRTLDALQLETAEIFAALAAFAPAQHRPVAETKEEMNAKTLFAPVPEMLTSS
jgi:PAS domain S-box-containing protein